MSTIDFDAWRRAIKDDVSFNYHYEMGVALERTGDFDSALNHYGLALRALPGHVETMGRRVRLLQLVNRLDEAQSEDAAARQSSPGYWTDALLLIGLRHCLDEEATQAQSMFDAAFASGDAPSWMRDMAGLALHLARNDAIGSWSVPSLPLQIAPADAEKAARFADALIALANKSNAKGSPEIASAAMSIAVQIVPDALSGSSMLIAGRCHFQTGQMAQAAKELAIAVDRGETGSLTMLSLGLSLVHLGRWTEGRDRLQDALKSSPQDVGVRYALAYALLHGGVVGEALRILDETSTLAPGDGWAHLFQVNAHLEQDDVPAAREALARARSLSMPPERLAYYAAAIALHTGEYDQALAALDHGTGGGRDGFSSDGVFPLLRGGIMRAAGSADRAVGPLTEAYRLSRNLPWPGIVLASCLLDLDRDDEAAAVVSRLQADYAGNPWLHLLEGRIAQKRGDDETSKHCFRTAFSSGLSTAMADFYLGGKRLAAADIAKASQSLSS